MKKMLSQACVFLGIALVVLTVYQINQYMTTTAAIAPSIDKINQLAADPALLSSAGMTATDLESTKTMITATTGAMTTTILMDAFLAVVFLAIGLLTYPKKD